jgi:hypothetical protein
LRQLLSRDMRQVGAHLNAYDLASATSERHGCLPRAAPDFEDARSRGIDSRQREQIIEEKRGNFAAARIVKLRDLVECANSPKPRIVVHHQFTPPASLPSPAGMPKPTAPSRRR